MICIEREYSGFKVKVTEKGMGRGFSTHARNLKEAQNAIDHYYGQPGHGNNRKKTCPFCRDLAAKGRK